MWAQHWTGYRRHFILMLLADPGGEPLWTPGALRAQSRLSRFGAEERTGVGRGNGLVGEVSGGCPQSLLTIVDGS